MSKKIIGITVGTQLPKPNFKQTDPTKGDYIRNKPDFEGLRTDVNDIKTLVGDASVSEQINSAIANKADYDDVITVEGGAALTLEDIFGEPPYTIEITEETEELSNITVAAGSDYATYRLRNIAIVTEIPMIMNDGDIALVISQGG